MTKFSMDDYVDVAERIQDFKDAHPDGTLQTISWEVKEVDGKTFIVYRAAAYRDASDCRPGHGTAWEPFPGRTPYTKDSELMNAETAAWGRAVCALGLVSNRKLASRQEVRARMGDQEAETAKPKAKPRAKTKVKPNGHEGAVEAAAAARGKFDPTSGMIKPAAAESVTSDGPSPAAVKALIALHDASPWKGDTDYSTLRMQLAIYDVSNEGEIAECIASLQRPQFEQLWTTLEEASA